MTFTLCPNTAFDNSRMAALGYEILAIETHHYPDQIDETDILWTRTAPPPVIAEHELPF